MRVDECLHMEMTYHAKYFTQFEKASIPSMHSEENEREIDGVCRTWHIISI